MNRKKRIHDYFPVIIAYSGKNSKAIATFIDLDTSTVMLLPSK